MLCGPCYTEKFSKPLPESDGRYVDFTCNKCNKGFKHYNSVDIPKVCEGCSRVKNVCHTCGENITQENQIEMSLERVA